MMWVPSLTFLLLTLFSICYGDNPGVNIQITQHGLQKGVEYLLNQMISTESVYELPDVTGSENIATEDMSYAFTQIRMVAFHHGTISSQWISKTGMHISMENGDATINCNWNLDSWLIKDSGSSVLTLSGLSISMMMGVQRIDPGVASINLVDCQSSIQDVDVQIFGGISYIVDNLKEPIRKVVRQNMNQQLCSFITNQVPKWDQAISGFNYNVSLNNLIEIDTSLVGNPEISDKHANLGLKGLFRTHNESHSEAAFSPAPMTLPDQDGAAVYMGISQSSLDSLSSAYFSAGFVTFQVSHIAASKNITTSELAAYMPEISQQFPSPVPVKIQMHATRPPQVLLQSNNMTIQFFGPLQTYDHSSKAKSKMISSVDLMASFQVNLSLSEAKGKRGFNITGSAILNRLQIEGSQPVIEGQKGVMTENGVQQLFRDLVTPAVNEELAAGTFVASNVLKSADVVIQQGLAILAANFE